VEENQLKKGGNKRNAGGGRKTQIIVFHRWGKKGYLVNEE
jgi:hypothetical protein